MKTQYNITVSLVTWNGAKWLPFCLEALNQSTVKDYFLLIIDNGSIDSSNEIIENYLERNPELKRRARLIRNRFNLGFARAHNQAIAWTEGEYVFVLNQDVVISSTYIDDLRHSLENDERAASATGTLLRWDFDVDTYIINTEPSASSQVDSCGLKIKRTRRVVNDAQGEQYSSISKVSHQVFGVSATAALYRRSSIMRVAENGEVFDDSFMAYKEDVDLAWRLQNAGYDSWHIPTAIALHARSIPGSGGLLGEIKQRRLRHRQNKIQSYSNHLACLLKNERLSNLFKDIFWINYL